jgi:Methyltransferase domain
VTLTSPLYWSPWVYRLVMRALYGRAYDERYRVVADLVPDGSHVVDLCCGCGYLYTEFLAKRGIAYTGVDLLPAMTRVLRQRPVQLVHGGVLDLVTLPTGDICLMLGSLYHFHPREADVLCRMAASAPRALLLEPVKNLNQSASRTVRLLSGAATYIGGTRSSYRLDSARLDAVLAQAGVPVYSDRRVLGGRYRLVEFGRSPDSTARRSRSDSI